MFSLATSQVVQAQAADAPVSNRLYLWMEVLIGIAEVRMRMTSAKSTLYEPKSPHWRTANCIASSIPLVSVWHSQVGIANCGHGAMEFGSPSFKPGSTCLRYHMSDSLLVDCAFEPVDGGKDRACRGMNESDNLDSHYTVHLTWPENSSVESCQDLCQNTLGCKGIEFRLGACEIWMLTEGIQASVWAAGRTCMRYEPFQSVDGFNDRVCRGSNATDSLDEYFDIYSPLQAPTLEACQNLCSTTVWMSRH